MPCSLASQKLPSKGPDCSVIIPPSTGAVDNPDQIQGSTYQVKFLETVWVGSQLLVPLAFKEYFFLFIQQHYQKGDPALYWTFRFWRQYVSHGHSSWSLYWLTANQHALGGDQTTGFIGNGSRSHGMLFTYGTSPSQ